MKVGGGVMAMMNGPWLISVRQVGVQRLDFNAVL